MSQANHEAVEAGETASSYDEGVADAYSDAFFYQDGSDYQRWYVGIVAEHLRLRAPHRLVDIGGGTGNFTVALTAHVQDGSTASQGPVPVCVDNSAQMLAKARDAGARVDTVLADAVEYAERAAAESPASIDRVLMKELLHHLPAESLAPFFTGLCTALRPGGVALAVTRPQQVDYPLFEAARRVWADNQPPVEDFVGAMRQGGLEAEVVVVDRECRVAKSAWLGMVRQRFWSTFAREHFDDAALQARIDEIDAQHADSDELRFVDRLLFVVATKPEQA